MFFSLIVGIYWGVSFVWKTFTTRSVSRLGNQLVDSTFLMADLNFDVESQSQRLKSISKLRNPMGDLI